MMSLGGSTSRVAVALAISLGITAMFVIAGPLAVEDVVIESNVGGVAPAPIAADFAQTGEPPNEVGDFPQFEEAAAEVGFVFEPRVPTGIEMVDSGVYVSDTNNDGYQDILAVGEEYPVLFVNTGGKFVEYRTFEKPRVKAAHFFDYNNNGYEDLLLAQYGGGFILYENVDGNFIERDVGLDTSLLNPSSIVSADFTGNGCLDLFVTQNGLWSGTTPLTHADAQRVKAGHPEVRPTTESGNPNLLYHGDCESFTEITDQAGISGSQWTLTSSAADFTGNGWPDIHVGNDWSEDYIYKNGGERQLHETRDGAGFRSQCHVE